MRNRKGMGGVIGILGLGIIFLIGLMFIPNIFGHIGNATELAGTDYAVPYAGIQNVTATTGGHVLPAIIIFIFIIGIVVALMVFIGIRKR